MSSEKAQDIYKKTYQKLMITKFVSWGVSIFANVVLVITAFYFLLDGNFALAFVFNGVWIAYNIMFLKFCEDLEDKLHRAKAYKKRKRK